MKKIEEIAFRKGLRKINEGGINRIMSHGENGFIVISANRSEVFSSNPECDLTDEYVKYCKLNNEEPNYVGQNGEKQNSSSSKDFKINRDDEMFYTTTRRDKNDPQRFTADIQFENMYRSAGPSTYFNRMKRMKTGEVFLD